MSWKTRNSGITHPTPNAGLTAVEILIAAAIIAGVVIATMIYASRHDRAFWTALAAANPRRVFDLDCRVLRHDVESDENVEFLCAVANRSPYPLTLSWDHVLFRTAHPKGERYLGWRIVKTEDENAQAFTHYAQIRDFGEIPPHEPLLVRIELERPLRYQPDPQSIRDPVTFKGTITLKGSQSVVTSNQVSFTVKPATQAKSNP